MSVTSTDNLQLQSFSTSTEHKPSSNKRITLHSQQHIIDFYGAGLKAEQIVTNCNLGLMNAVALTTLPSSDRECSLTSFVEFKRLTF